MTVLLVTAIYEYIGLAADVKPTSGVPAGSRFTEADTATLFIFDGTDWHEQ